jgi:hypothetical protein
MRWPVDQKKRHVRENQSVPSMPTCSGPTTGDRVRLADTDLIIEVEKDFTTYGEEVKFGGGKVIRDGMGQSPGHQQAGRGRHRHHQCADRRSLGHREGRRRIKEGRIAPSARPAIPTSSPASPS